MLFRFFDLKKFCFPLFVGLGFWGSAFAEGLPLEVLPFSFSKVGSDSASQTDMWNDLMKYKLWGTGLYEGDGIAGSDGKSAGDGIVFDGSEVHITDSSGYVGSATGDFRMVNNFHSIGGPLVFGGSFKSGLGTDSILIGPSHFAGDFEVTDNARYSEFFAGKYCVEGQFIQNSNCDPGPDSYYCATQGFNTGKATFGCEDAFPIDSLLDVPSVDYSFLETLDDDHYKAFSSEISANVLSDDAYIDVPPGAIDDMYNIRAPGIRLQNDKALYVRMQKSGRLTRIFLDGGIEITNHSNIRVIQAANDNEWDDENKVWKTSDTCVVDNKDYAGNLLIYTPEAIHWTAGSKHLQGTFISAKTINIAQEARFAGQLIAKAIYVEFDFKAEDFRYVRFNPAVIDPTLFSTVEFPESESDTVIPLKLSKKTQVKVTFDYCFELSSNAPVDGKTSDKMADASDFVGLTPICGNSLESAVIFPNSDTLELSDQIRIHAKLDQYIELYGSSDKERFRMKVSNLVGAVLKNESGEYVRDGYFDMYVIDRNAVPLTKDTSVVAYEDSVLTFTVDMFPYESPLDRDMAGLVVESLPSKGSLTYLGMIVSKTGVMIPMDSLGQLKYVAKDDEFGSAPTYVYASMKFAVYDSQNYVSSSDKKEGSKTLTINVLPVNDAPVASPATYTVSGHSVVGGTNLKGSIPVTDVDDSSFTYAFDSTDANFKLVDSLFVIDANTGVISVKKGVTLKRSTSDSLYVIGVVVSDKSASTGDDDDILSSVANVNIVIDYGYDPPSVDIVNGTNSQGSWDDPVIIKTNVPDIVLSCNYDGSKDRVECLNTTLVDGCHVYSVKYENPDKDGVAYDSVEICLSTAAPVVTVGAKDNKVTADNIYTVVEDSDAKDPNYYVNSVKNPITVTVLDTVAKVSKTYSVDLELDTVGVSKSTLSAMEAIVDANIGLDQDRAFVVRTPVNGKTILVSYKESYNGKDSVTVSYVTDNNGDIVKEAVLNDKGKIDSIAVYTITYTATVNGKTINISYKADASTGAMLLVDANGNLMTEGAADDKFAKAVPYTVSYDYVDKNGNSVNVTYAVDKSGDFVTDESGNVGYKVSYTYVNEYGNSASSSVYIVLDQIPPKVEITYPHGGDVIHANFVEVAWEVNGVVQDTLTLQSLEKGYNPIVRFYKDKAGNVAVDTVWVIMKDAKDIAVSIEQPVTVVTKEKMDEYYSSNPPKDGETFAVSIRNPSTGKEVETLIGGDFKNEKGSGEAPYANVDDGSHLGPTLVMDIKVPVVSAVGGLATLDDLIGSDGLVSVDGVDAANSKKISVQEYVSEYCEEDVGFANASDVNLYDIKMDVKIWIYTTLGNFVDYVHFNQSLNDPSYANDAGLLQMFFELKPDKNGDVRDVTGRLYATGSYVYKVEVGMKNTLRCTLPPVEDISGKKRGDVIKTNDNLLKPFGYKRPKW